MTLTFDAVVVGAGPAGLSAAEELSRRGSCLLLERGPVPPVRRHDVDLLSGVGGAGLFSDGKHSFFPSATGLWRLPGVEPAFERTAELLRRHGVEVPERERARSSELFGAAFTPKPYPSLSVSFEERLRCIEALWASAQTRWSGAQVVDAARSGGELRLTVSRSGELVDVRTQRLVVATGRWSARWTRPWLEKLGARFGFRHVEFGVRLEGGVTESLFSALPGLDGKLRLVEGPLEARTFCTCRDGEVVLGEADGLRAWSGRADGPRTGRSNVGLVVRTADEAVGRAVLARLETSAPRRVPLAHWWAGGAGTFAPDFGEQGAALLWRALERLGAWHGPVRTMKADVYSPCIEGVGDYPLDDGQLEVAPGVRVAGDLTGRFRGIVASMVSGRYAALASAKTQP